MQPRSIRTAGLGLLVAAMAMSGGSVGANGGSLRDAIRQNDVAAAKRLIAQGTDVNAADDTGATPLMYARSMADQNGSAPSLIAAPPQPTSAIAVAPTICCARNSRTAPGSSGPAPSASRHASKPAFRMVAASSFRRPRPVGGNRSHLHARLIRPPAIVDTDPVPGR